jgi:hypothetical protein
MRWNEQCTKFIENEMPLLREDVPLKTRPRMFFQHDGFTAYIGDLVVGCLNLYCNNHWNGCAPSLLCPLRSRVLTDLDFLL